MFCSNCGGKIAGEAAIFCPFCGTELFSDPSKREANHEIQQENKNKRTKYNINKKADILSYAKNLDIRLDKNFVYGYTEPTFKSVFFLGVFSILSELKNFIVAFTPDEVILFGLTVTGKFASADVIISWEDIEKLEIKSGIMQNKVTIKLKNDDKIILQINKRILGKSWQKENLEFLNKNNWYQ